MMILALDTSTRTIGLAVYNGFEVLSETIWGSQDYHTMQLAPAVDDLLRHANLNLDDLKAIAIATGPGSFTGLRIGIALAKGLAIARHLPLIGIPSLDVLAAAQPVQAAPLAAVLRAGRGRLAVGWYQAKANAWQPEGQLEVLTVPELFERIEEPTIVCGELAHEDRQVLARKRKIILLSSPAQSLRRPSFLAELAWKRLRKGLVDDPVGLTPIYLHYKNPIEE